MRQKLTLFDFFSFSRRLLIFPGGNPNNSTALNNMSCYLDVAEADQMEEGWRLQTQVGIVLKNQICSSKDINRSAYLNFSYMHTTLGITKTKSHTFHTHIHKHTRRFNDWMRWLSSNTATRHHDKLESLLIIWKKLIIIVSLVLLVVLIIEVKNSCYKPWTCTTSP